LISCAVLFWKWVLKLLLVLEFNLTAVERDFYWC
jgi:hypothetical protein